MTSISLLSLALAVAFACGEALAQATFAVRNRSPGVDAPVYDWGGNLLWSTDWRAELYGGATPDSLTPLLDFYTWTRGTAAFYQPGYFRRSGGSGDMTVFAAPPDRWVWLQVKVWDVQLGATYEEASARGLGGYGQSAPFYAQGNSPLRNPPDLPAPLIGLQSFSVLQPIPEPSTLALLAAGLAGLVLVRRKRESRVSRVSRALS